MEGRDVDWNKRLEKLGGCRDAVDWNKHLIWKTHKQTKEKEKSYLKKVNIYKNTPNQDFIITVKMYRYTGFNVKVLVQIYNYVCETCSVI